MGNLTGSFAVVTGAGKGIGYAVAKRFLEDNAAGVALFDMDYELVSASGEAHKPTFTMRVLLSGCELAIGVGSSKQAAQQQAAEIAYNKLKGSADACD